MSTSHNNKHGTYMRLKIASEFLNGKDKTSICREYGITAPTLRSYIKMFNTDYLQLIGFYIAIMGELWENGYKGAAQHLRNNAPRLFREDIGALPPEDVTLDFDSTVPPEEQRKYSDIVNNPLSILDELTNDRK